jgi:uncharacterized protein YpiB (UPF0302 family)
MKTAARRHSRSPWGNDSAYHAGKFMDLVQNRKRQTLRFNVHSFAMKTRKGAIVIERLDQRRYAVTVDGIVRFVGTQEECQQRVAMLSEKEDRADQNKALVQSIRRMR